jgi:hypothetical protein
VAAGALLRVRVLRGQSPLDLEARREELAACLRVREVRVERERADAANVRVTLVRRDPFEDSRRSLGRRRAEHGLMELAGLEPATSWVRSRRSPN